MRKTPIRGSILQANLHRGLAYPALSRKSTRIEPIRRGSRKTAKLPRMVTRKLAESRLRRSGRGPKQGKKFRMDALERFSLKGKVALVTGSGGVIGSAIAQGYLSVGAAVAISDSVLRPGFETPGWAYSSGKL